MLLFLKEDNGPAPEPRDFGEPLEHRVQAEGAEGAVAAAQPHQWNQLLLFSFIFVFSFYPSWGTHCRRFSREGSWHGGRSQHTDPWWGARSFGKPTIADTLLQAGTAVQGDEEESQLRGAASLLFYLRTGEG